MNDARPLIEEMGFEVWETPDAVLFCDRRISMLWFWRLFLGIWTAALLLVTPAVGLILAFRGASAGYAVMGIGIGVGALTGLATRAIHRAFERRRTAPLEDVPRIATIDRATNTLRERGQNLAPCSEAHARIEIARGDSSRGLMRWVVVRAGKRRLRLFKTSSLGTAKRVRDVLRAYGVPTT